MTNGEYTKRLPYNAIEVELTERLKSYAESMFDGNALGYVMSEKAYEELRQDVAKIFAEECTEWKEI